MDSPILPIVNSYRKYYTRLQPYFQKPKTRSYTTVIFFFLVLSLFGWYAIRPTIQTILYLQREIKDKKELNLQMDEKINALIQAQAAYEGALPAIPLIAEALPPNPQALSLVSSIKSITDNMSSSISALQISEVPIGEKASTESGKPTATVGKTNEFALTLSLTGSFQSLSSFVKELLSIKRIVRINTMNFAPLEIKTSTKSASISPRLKLSLTAASFYLSP